jgi:hypothetical protein
MRKQRSWASGYFFGGDGLCKTFLPKPESTAGGG